MEGGAAPRRGWRTLRPPLHKHSLFGLPVPSAPSGPLRLGGGLIPAVGAPRPPCQLAHMRIAMTRPQGDLHPRLPGRDNGGINEEKRRLVTGMTGASSSQGTNDAASSPYHPVLPACFGILKKHQLARDVTVTAVTLPPPHDGRLIPPFHATPGSARVHADKICRITQYSKLMATRSSRGCKTDPFPLPTPSSGGVQLPQKETQIYTPAHWPPLRSACEIDCAKICRWITRLLPKCQYVPARRSVPDDSL